MANTLDYKYFIKIVNVLRSPECACFKTSKLRYKNHTFKPGTTVAYSTLIYMVPSDPSNGMTAMKEAQGIMRKTGRIITVFTAYQQLYNITVNVM